MRENLINSYSTLETGPPLLVRAGLEEFVINNFKCSQADLSIFISP